MRARSTILAIWAVAALPLLGCDRTDRARDTAAGRDVPATEAAQVITGDLRTVDAQAMTFVVRGDDGTERAFKYTATTEVAGGPSTQGLAGREGNRVRVSYRDVPQATDTTAPVVLEAIRIEMVPTDQR
jgi:hypothetical protein